MNLTGNTVLVTGASSGIGRALAERFAQRGNQVVACARRADRLHELAEQFPNVHVVPCDVTVPAQRQQLVELLTREFPELNVVINNAGIQQWINVQRADREWAYYQQEISVNLEAPIHLTLLLLPHLLRQQVSYVINVTSGLALAPAVWAPVYSATKAGLRSFTIALRRQLADAPVNVVEVLPPAVNTDLGGPGLHTFGVPVDEFADAVMEGLAAGSLEIGYAGTERLLAAPPDQLRDWVEQMWQGFLGRHPDF
ncbi:MAG: SDR family NAD(P)-dependent oxidoreductase [Alicyclobacillaceae bacterium]|nr:SDR family NAD(P)-dependent oxidoreductase [Alicyclobacillaceae bacterium]